MPLTPLTEENARRAIGLVRTLYPETQWSIAYFHKRYDQDTGVRLIAEVHPKTTSSTVKSLKDIRTQLSKNEAISLEEKPIKEKGMRGFLESFQFNPKKQIQCSHIDFEQMQQLVEKKMKADKQKVKKSDDGIEQKKPTRDPNANSIEEKKPTSQEHHLLNRKKRESQFPTTYQELEEDDITIANEKLCAVIKAKDTEIICCEVIRFSNSDVPEYHEAETFQNGKKTIDFSKTKLITFSSISDIHPSVLKQLNIQQIHERIDKGLLDILRENQLQPFAGPSVPLPSYPIRKTYQISAEGIGKLASLSFSEIKDLQEGKAIQRLSRISPSPDERKNATFSNGQNPNSLTPDKTPTPKGLEGKKEEKKPSRLDKFFKKQDKEEDKSKGGGRGSHS